MKYFSLKFLHVPFVKAIVANVPLLIHYSNLIISAKFIFYTINI